MIQNETGDLCVITVYELRFTNYDLRFSNYGLVAHESIVQLLTSPIKKAGFPRLN